MNNTISVPRELRQVLGTILNALDRDALEGRAVRGEMAQELRALLAAPAVEVEGLEEVGFVALGGIFHGGSGPELGDIDVVPYMGVLERIQYELVNSSDDVIVPLCSLPKAQAIIDQQAARIAELQKDADRYRWLEANSTYGIDYRQRPELTLPIYAPDHREGLDAAIDAVMGSKGDE